jgi:hypothetical protein
VVGVSPVFCRGHGAAGVRGCHKASMGSGKRCRVVVSHYLHDLRQLRVPGVGSTAQVVDTAGRANSVSGWGRAGLGA